MKKQLRLQLIQVFFLSVLNFGAYGQEPQLNSEFEQSGITYKVTSTSPNPYEVEVVGNTNTGDVVIPRIVVNVQNWKITSIGNSAFERDQLTSIDIPEGVTHIGEKAFADNSINSVVIPTTVTSIGITAFWNNGIASLEIPEGIADIGDNTFGRNNLASVTIPASVTSIGNDAFITHPSSPSKMTRLIMLGSTPPTLQDNSFTTRNDIHVTVPDNAVGTYEARKDSDWNGFAIIYQPIEIGDHIEKYLEYKGGVTVTYEMTSINYLDNSPYHIAIIDWDNEEAMSDIQIPERIDNFIVTEIGTNAFRDKQLGGSITIPATVTNIGKRAFRRNDLTSVTIPKSVTNIEDGAFEFNNITQVMAQDGTTAPTVERTAFTDDNENSHITLNIPHGATAVYNSAGWSTFNIEEELLENGLERGILLGEIYNTERLSGGGTSVGLSKNGNVVAVGSNSNYAPGSFRRGFVRVYEKDADGVWNQLGSKIDGEGPIDWEGDTVSLSNDGYTMAIGAHGHNDESPGSSTGEGHVRVFNYNGSEWIQVGANIDGEAKWDSSGASVSLSGDGNIVAIGAPNNDENGYSSGHVRVFNYNGSEWIQVGDDIDGEAERERLGHAVSLSENGGMLAIGTLYGAVKVYQNISGQWVQVGSDIGARDGDEFAELGHSVSLSNNGNILAMGAPGGQSLVRVYERDDTVPLGWRQIGSDIKGEVAEDRFGDNIVLSGDGNTLAVGAPLNGGNGDDSGQIRVYKYVADTWQLSANYHGEPGNRLGGYRGRFGSNSTISRNRNIGLSDDGTIIAMGNPNSNASGSSAGQTRIYNIALSGVEIQPSRTINTSTSNGFEVTFKFDRAVTGFTESDIVLTNAVASNFSGNGTTYTAMVTPISCTSSTIINVPANIAFDVDSNIGNLVAREVIVEAVDNVPPDAKTKNITVALGANGQVILNTDQIDDGSTDNCEVEAMFIGSNQVISSEGIFDVELIVEDVNGNRASAFAKVTVEAPPTVSIGNVPSSVENLEPFPMEIVFSKAVTGFELADIQVTSATVSTLTGSGSTYTATLTPTSPCGDITIDVPTGVATVANSLLHLPNQAAAQVIVAVVDAIAPTIACPADVVADAADNGTGDCTTTVALGSPVIEDNCSVAAVVAQVNGAEIDPDSYAFGTGTTTVTWTVRDASGNTTSCQQTVTVGEDLDNLVAMAKDITVKLDADGTASISPDMVDNGSSYGCNNTPELSLDITTFDCDDVGTPVTVVLTAAQGGETATATAVVTVEGPLDNLVAIAHQDITVQLDNNGQATISPDMVDNGSSYGCNNTPELSLDITTFDCDDVGTPVTVVLTAAQGGETETVTAVVTVEGPLDNLVAIAHQDITVQLDNNGQATISPDMVDNGSSYGCNNTPELSLDITTFDCDDVGTPVTVVLTAAQGGETATATAVVTVEATGNCAPEPGPRPLVDFNRGFSPNSDGIGDTFVIDGLERYENNVVKIYNLSQRLLFSAHYGGPGDAWDGTDERGLVPVGSYVCVIDYNEPGLGHEAKMIYVNY
ncbi:leucine-rich repeat protein [Muricauda sp. SCSIO 64092]|uniref:leucine-rich repeat protein n=1 Tax=Allomuricauda sp. SCSIO 64092 TaxID=2908842 RepID=UPI001FF64999|nr:leucine-rich repeat protein [Muricauda sp. SCSIO 64092]UOY06561.1 leucine-rich repeat protein [Muricauda sp. SCSIO 64092]